MDAKVSPTSTVKPVEKPSQAQAEDAVRTLLAWAGDNPNREGLLDTPRRVAKAYREYFAGYDQDPADFLARTFSETGGYDDFVLLRDITFTSHCEHHIAPFYGKAHVAYIPDGAIVGISKIARVVEAYARRLQTQEVLTAQVANCLCGNLPTRGVAVMVEAVHTCMSSRGVGKPNVATVTTQFTKEFKSNATWQARFMEQLRMPRQGISL